MLSTVGVVAGCMVALLLICSFIYINHRQYAVSLVKDLSSGKINLHSMRGQKKLVRVKMASISNAAKEQRERMSRGGTASLWTTIYLRLLHFVASIGVKARILVSLFQVC